MPALSTILLPALLGFVAAPAPPEPASDGAARTEGWIAIDAWRANATTNQVRIERRVIIRIAPRRPAAGTAPASLAPRAERSSRIRLIEQPMRGCVSLENIASSRVGSSNRILLFLRDREIVSARMPATCRARDFYSGFYVEPNEDRRLCPERDMLRSRVGSSCSIETLSRMVRATS